MKHNWDFYLDTQLPIDLNNVKIGDKYFMTAGPGKRTGVVTVLSADYKYGIEVSYDDNKSPHNIIFPNIPSSKYYDENKKLYKIVDGGRRTRQNKKSRKARKSRRKHARRTGRRI